MIPSDQQSEHSKACFHDGMCLRRYERLSVLVPPQTHAVMAASSLMTSIPTAYHRLRTDLDQLTLIHNYDNVTPLIWMSIYHNVTLLNILTITLNLSPTLTTNPITLTIALL